MEKNERKKKRKKRKKKNTSSGDANILNSAVKFHLHPHYGFWADLFFHKLNIWMRWQPIQFIGLIKIHIRGLLKNHFCISVVIISPVR